MALSFCGLRTIIEKGGLALGLIACPLISLAAILSVCAVGTEQSDERFWTVQIVLVFVNVVQYALNGPCREMLYVRSTKDVKYKAKSWSDMYGNIMQKTVAAQINLNINDKQFQPVWSGTFCSVWVAVWMVIAMLLGIYHTKLEKEKKQIGLDDTGMWYCLKGKDCLQQKAKDTQRAREVSGEAQNNVSIQEVGATADAERGESTAALNTLDPKKQRDSTTAATAS